ncbi:MAG: hypothetical protein M9894_01695 [Planctomycetes bacterium]|nr:hypothetical protein [Planctomycetota bacterium]
MTDERDDDDLPATARGDDLRRLLRDGATPRPPRPDELARFLATALAPSPAAGEGPGEARRGA